MNRSGAFSITIFFSKVRIILFVTGFLLLQLYCSDVLAQIPTQVVRGTVTDKVSQEKLFGATVLLLDSSKTNGSVCDEDGKFRLDNVPLGRQYVRVSIVGYKETTIAVVVTSGKEVVLDIELEQSVIQGKEITIVAERQKDRANNEMTTVSARSFTVEETSRYAGSLNDPSRMAANYAGVSGSNDARNDIIIRGNSPLGLLWRLNGIEIPNPNHFGSIGTTGGPISILNNNLLDKSDFMTSAFPAEYGNALAGVFDLQMRTGNNEKREYLGQLGFNGFELGAEGPMGKNGGSYLANYRYSTLGVFQAVGIEIGAGAAVPQYQDLSFNLSFPTAKSGKFSVFGIGGISNVEVLDEERDTTATDLYNDGARQDGYFGNKMGVIGVQHTYFFNSNTYSKLNISASTAGEDYKVDSISSVDEKPVPVYRNSSNQQKYSLNYSWNKKFSSRDYLKVGFILDRYQYSYQDSSYEFDHWQKYTDFDDGSFLLQVYSQLQHKFTDRLSVNLGLHYQQFMLNQTNAIEPRAGIRWEMKEGQALSAGAGFHSQLQPMYIYFQKTYLPDASYIETNTNLGLTRSIHYVLAFDKSLGQNMRLKTEAYYQNLYQVPIETRPSWYSILNEGADFGIGSVDSLHNSGDGENYGLELTLEKFYSHGYYFLFTGSLFESKYTGSDGLKRNTAFNGNFTVNLLGGKEWTIRKKNVIAFNLKMTYAGGKRYVPINEEASEIAGETVYDYHNAYEDRRKDYFRTDIKISYRMNRKKATHEISLDIDNIFNTQNIWQEVYDPNSGTIKTEYQLGIFPIPLYRVTF
ncbi:MAG: TonB-dependent receptor [Bacteroidia bacterium]|nr:TonB-dependent receptor [Bacteroidia bacterium]